MGTLAGVANGLSTNLIQRAADVHLKERRKLIVVPRETPLGSIQLENMKRLADAGAVVLPAMPGFYHQPKSIERSDRFCRGTNLRSAGSRQRILRVAGVRNSPRDLDSGLPIDCHLTSASAASWVCAVRLCWSVVGRGSRGPQGVPCRSRGDDRLSARRENFACLLSLHASRCAPRPRGAAFISHSPDTAVEFHDEQPDCLPGKLRGLFADTASGERRVKPENLLSRTVRKLFVGTRVALESSRRRKSSRDSQSMARSRPGNLGRTVKGDQGMITRPNRRDFLHVGFAGGIGLTLADLFRLEARADWKNDAEQRGKGQVGHLHLSSRRCAASGNVRSQAIRSGRISRTDEFDRDERRRHRAQRVSRADGEGLPTRSRSAVR